MIEASDWIAAASGLGGVIVGSGLTFLFWQWQDRTTRRREWIAKHLREAYFKVIDSSAIQTAESGYQFEKMSLFAQAINEIGLLGNDRTKRVARDIAQKLEAAPKTQEWVSYDPLLDVLQAELRHELGLRRSDVGPVLHVRRTDSGPEKETA